MKGVLLNSSKIITTDGGNVLHAMKNNELGFTKFGEAYFSSVEPRAIKAWKCHQQMVLNIVVPVGEIKFVLFDNRPKSKTNGDFQEVLLSQKNYQRLTVPPMVWMGFQGLSSDGSMLLNMASIVHNSLEVDRKNIEKIEFNWSD